MKTTMLIATVLATLLLSADFSSAQPMYEDDEMSFTSARYSSNNQYRIRFACASGSCAVIQDVWNGSSYVPRAYVFDHSASPFGYLKMDWGNLIWYSGSHQLEALSFTYSEAGENWLNIQDDGNIVIYDSNNNPLWTPACEFGGSHYLSMFPFDRAYCP